MNRGTSVQHVADVVAISDRVLRNYWVTQTYADLSKGLQNLLAPDTANWCTFATWASCTVGASMRGEALPRWLYERVLLPDGLMGAVAQTKAHHGWAGVAQRLRDLTPEHLLEVTRELLGEMSLNLSDGNTEVFAEIAPPAAQMLAALGNDAAPDLSRDTVLAACDGAREFEGVNHLRAGYSLWCDALATSDPTRRSQLILAGSLHLGVHEQNHLQAVIVASMDMGVNQSAARLKQKLGVNGVDIAKASEALDAALRPAVKGIAVLWDDIMTATLGTLTSPEGTMRLDHDVPPRPNAAFVPVDVAPVIVDQLASLREQFDRAHEGGKGSHALDWASFKDRMNFIANLFISRHHEPLIFQAPFSEAQLADLYADRVPSAKMTTA